MRWNSEGAHSEPNAFNAEMYPNSGTTVNFGDRLNSVGMGILVSSLLELFTILDQAIRNH
jgi:hypothetical protein